MTTIRPKFLLPDRYVLFEFVDDILATREGRLTVDAAHGNDHGGIPDGQVAGAVVEGHGVEIELGAGRGGNFFHFLHRHGRIGFEFEVGDRFAEIQVTDRTLKVAQTPTGGVQHERTATLEGKRITAEYDIQVIGIIHRPRGV